MRSCTFTLSTLLLLSTAAPTRGEIRYSTDGCTFEINSRGEFASIATPDAGAEYVPDGQASPILTLYADTTVFRPVAIERAAKPSRITLSYENGCRAVVQVENKGTYLRLELLELAPRNGVTAVCWGPLATTIRKLIGETICVVRDDAFSIGMQGLNIWTMGGTPLENPADNAGGGQRVQPLPGQTIPKTLRTNVFKDGDISTVARSRSSAS